MEFVGLLIFAALFIYSGYKHIRYHETMAGYSRTAYGNCPIGDQLAYLGGWPTGLILIVLAVGTIINESSFFAYGLAVFLTLTLALYHRTQFKDPATIKHVSLIGAALFIASQVH